MILASDVNISCENLNQALISLQNKQAVSAEVLSSECVDIGDYWSTLFHELGLYPDQNILNGQYPDWYLVNPDVRHWDLDNILSPCNKQLLLNPFVVNFLKQEVTVERLIQLHELVLNCSQRKVLSGFRTDLIRNYRILPQFYRNGDLFKYGFMTKEEEHEFKKGELSALLWEHCPKKLIVDDSVSSYHKTIIKKGESFRL